MLELFERRHIIPRNTTPILGSIEEFLLEKVSLSHKNGDHIEFWVEKKKNIFGIFVGQFLKGF